MPGGTVEDKELVGKDEALATIEDKGTAVGFVERRVKVTEGGKEGVTVNDPEVADKPPETWRTATSTGKTIIVVVQAFKTQQHHMHRDGS